MKILLYIGCCLSFTTCSTSGTSDTAITSDTTAATTAIVTPSSPADTALNREDLTGTWLLKEMPGIESSWYKVPVLMLDVTQGTFSGNTGCNGMSGRFVLQGRNITFDNEIITTKMGCVGKYNEQTFIQNLLRVNNYSINDTTLQLRQLDTVKMIFKRRPI